MAIASNTAPIDEQPDERLERLLKNGFVKELTYKFIKVTEDGKVKCTEVDFFAADHQCFTCKTNAYRVLRSERTGVILTCAWCNTTNGPISKEEGDERTSYEITPDEAIAILKSRNAHQRYIHEVQKLKSPNKQVRRTRPRPTTSS